MWYVYLPLGIKWVNKEQEEEGDEPLPVANIASRQCGAVLGG